LFQAGSSGRGQAFAARHAECVFVSQQAPQALKTLIADVRTAARIQGRNAEDIKFFMGTSVVVAPTEAQAREKYAEYVGYASAEAGLAHYASSSGIDFSQYGPDEPIRYQKNNAIESVMKNLTTAGRQRTVTQILREELLLGGRYPVIVGTPAQVADQLIGWIEQTDIDGFNLARTVVPECYDDFIELVIPVLQERGVYKSAYASGTLREKLFGGQAYLPERHVGARWRTNARV
jgi:alkanesulfonate monooxygenase SsuD/methylene tetrahydromethanopterin reductase-like flavin-dependent oxidoreductase (luciferase family)